jgi:fructokinase
MPGGRPANTAVALARPGTPVALACRLSNDAFGRRLRRHLEENGVELSLAVSATEPSSLAVLGFAGQGVPDFRFYVHGTADWQWTTHEPPGRPPPAWAMRFGALASVLPPGAEVLLAWATGHAHATVITYDVNARPSLLPDRRAYRDRIDAWLRIAHVVKASSDDLDRRRGHRTAHPGRRRRSHVNGTGSGLRVGSALRQAWTASTRVPRREVRGGRAALDAGGLRCSGASFAP